MRGRRRQASPQAGRRRAVLVVADLMITVAITTILYVGWQVGWEDRQAQEQQAAQATRLAAAWSQPTTPTAPPAPTGRRRQEPPATGAAVGVVHIPRFGGDWKPRPLVEGVSSVQLAAGTGHYPGTALPGEVGNVGIAGHRVTHGSPFRRIADLRKGDAVVIETPQHWFVYRVTDREIVAPTRVAVLAPVPDAPGTSPSRRMLTLTTCHPLYSARERYVVHAELAERRSRAQGPPAQIVGA